MFFGNKNKKEDIIRRDNPERRETFVKIIKDVLPESLISLEIGVAAGDFSDFLLKELDIKKHYMLDPWNEVGDEKRSQWFSEINSADKTYQFVQDRFRDIDKARIVKDYSHNFLLESLKNSEKFDLIYVDGDHHAEAVYFDLMLSWELLDSGGVLAGDDYNWKSKSTKLFEVKKAVEKFEATYGLNFEIVDGDEGGLQQFYLVKE